MNLKILQCEDGAREAEGIAVIIDVFRAFSLEAYLYARGVKDILITKEVKHSLTLKKEHPEYILIGERDGLKCEGFDYGNSPSSLPETGLEGKIVVHTTSNGTRGIVNASRADEIITGSLVNARAIAEYIISKNPENVSLVCMGWGDRETEEDTLCAEYIRSLILQQPLADLEERAYMLREQEGKKFFNPDQQDRFPQGDFEMCIRHDLFDFVIQCVEIDGMIHNRRI